MIWLSDTNIDFPSLENVTEDGILALGGDLSPSRLKLAYTKGIFPWYSEVNLLYGIAQTLGWCCF